MKAKPSVSSGTARTESSKLLQNPDIQQAVQQATKQLETISNQSSLITRQSISDRAYQVETLALETGKLDTCLKSMDLQARINGLFTADSPDMNTYVQLIQSLTVNIAGNTPTIPETTEPIDIIDVIPEK